MLLARPLLHNNAAAAAAAGGLRCLVRRSRPAPLLGSFSGAMDSGEENPPSLTSLVLFSKSPTEIEAARSIKAKRIAVKLDGKEDEIVVLLESEIDPSIAEGFGARRFMDSLSTSLFGRLLFWSARLPSTHDLVSQNFAEIPLGTVCVADIQFKGRGRTKNVWESPAGCLMFSFTLQMEDGRKLPLLQYVVCLAMVEAIKDTCRAQGLPQLDVRIKWPNDLYLNGLKVGGILCTSTYRSKLFNVCAGIGLNIDNEKPTTCLNAVLRELSPASGRIMKADVLASFFNTFESLFEVFTCQGFQVLEGQYYNSWLHSGQKIVIQDRKDDQSVENVEVFIQGLTSSGYLLATDDENISYELHPDGNSLDFFKGLARKKLET